MKPDTQTLKSLLPTNWPIGNMVASNPWEGFSGYTLAETLRFFAEGPGLLPWPNLGFFLPKIHPTSLTDWAQSQDKSSEDYASLWQFLHSDAGETFVQKSVDRQKNRPKTHFETWFCAHLLDFIQNKEPLSFDKNPQETKSNRPKSSDLKTHWKLRLKKAIEALVSHQAQDYIERAAAG